MRGRVYQGGALGSSASRAVAIVAGGAALAAIVWAYFLAVSLGVIL